MKRILAACILVAGLVSPGSPVAWADVFVLSQGGRITGELQNPGQSPRQTYVVKTADGATVTLGRAQVKQVVRQRPEEIEYEKLRAHTPDTAEGQFELAQWCGENRLPVQRKAHLQRVVALDPEHEEARGALGYRRVDGKWFTQDELMLKRGYQRYQGRWLLPEEIAILEEKRDLNAAEKEWARKLALWQGWLLGPRAAEAREAISGIDDPIAVRALIGALRKNEGPDARVLFIQVLARLGTAEAVQALQECSLEDEADEVRMACLEHLKKRKDPAIADFYVRQLRSKNNNAIINRAALGVKELGDASAIGPLIDVLITVHRTRAPSKPPGQMSTTFGKGPGGGGIGFSAGGGGVKYVYHEIRNQVVLDALVAISGANFGFNVPAWRAWHAAQRKRAAMEAAPQ